MKTDKNKHNERTKTMKHTCNLQSLSSTYGFLFNSFAQFAMVPTWISQLCSTQILQVEQGRVWKSFLRVFCVFFCLCGRNSNQIDFCPNKMWGYFCSKTAFHPLHEDERNSNFSSKNQRKDKRANFSCILLGEKPYSFALTQEFPHKWQNMETEKLTFPNDVLWGTATTAFQIEGATQVN